MGNRVFSINSDEIDSIVEVLNNTVSTVDDSSSTMSNSVKGANESGIFGSSLNNFQKGIQNTTLFATNTKNIILNQKESIINLEDNLAKRIEDIEVPQDFVKTYYSEYYEIDDIQLSKRDGKAINTSKDDSDIHNVGDTAVQGIGLADISSGTAVKATANMDTIIDNQENIYNLTSDEAVKEQKISEEVSEEEVNLKDITSEELTDKEISKDSNINEQKKIFDMSNNGELSDNVLSSNTTLNGTNMGNITGENVASADTDLSSMMQTQQNINKMTSEGSQESNEQTNIAVEETQAIYSPKKKEEDKNDSNSLFGNSNMQFGNNSLGNVNTPSYSYSTDSSVNTYSNEDNSPKEEEKDVDYLKELMDNYSVYNDYERKKEQININNNDNNY